MKTNVSDLDPPVSVSAPPLPVIVSAPASPTRVSAAAVPRIVAATLPSIVTFQNFAGIHPYRPEPLIYLGQSR